jgi:hypothetical protein
MNNALPPYVFLPTGLFLAKLIAHKEGEDRSRWVTDFAVQLVEGAGRDDFARSLIDTAVIKQNAAMNRVRRSRAKSELISEGVKNPTRQQIEERLKEIYAEEEITAAATTREGVGESTTGCNPLTADGDTREDSLNTHSAGNRVASESGTSANHYDKDALDKQTISAKSPAGAGVNLDSTQTIKRQDASSGNAEGVNTNGSPITRNGSRAACTSATSGQTIEAPLRPGEWSTPEIERKSASLHSPTPIKTDPKPTRKAKAEVKPEEQKYPHGEFENIMLTTDEYVKLCERLDDADGLIAEADQYFEAQPEKKKKYKSHYAMLLSWDRRRKEAERPKRGYKTAAEKQRDELRKIADYYASKEAVG